MELRTFLFTTMESSCTAGRRWMGQGFGGGHLSSACFRRGAELRSISRISQVSLRRFRATPRWRHQAPRHASGTCLASATAPQRSPGAAIADFLSQNYIPVGMLSAIALGWAFPALGVAAAGAQLQLLATVGIFVVSGLVLQQGEALSAVKSTLALGFGLVSILLITPLLALVLVRLPLQPPEIGLGLAVYCCMPTSLSTNIALTQACNGNSAVSLLLTVTSNLLSVATVPLILPWVLLSAGAAAAGGGGVGGAGLVGFTAAGLFRTLVLTVLLPLLAGVAAQTFIPGVQAWRSRSRRPLSYLSTFFLCLVPWMQVSKAASARLALTPAAFAAAVAAGGGLHLVLLAYSVAVAGVLRFSRDAEQDAAIRKAVILATAQKTLPIAVSVLSHLGATMGPAIGFAVVPCVIAHLLQTVIDSMVVAQWNKGELKSAVAAGATTGGAAGGAVPKAA